MENIEELQESALRNDIGSGDFIGASDRVLDLKYSDEEDASFKKTESSVEKILTENEAIALEEQSIKCEDNLTSKELKNFTESSLSTPGVADLLVPSAAIGALDKNNIIQSDDICIENPFTSDNFLKPSLDDECNSDMQDEEIQLVWEDDEEEITFNSGAEEDYDNSAHFIEDEEEDKFLVHECKMEKSPENNFDITSVGFPTVIATDTEVAMEPISLKDTEFHVPLQTNVNAVMEIDLQSVNEEVRMGGGKNMFTNNNLRVQKSSEVDNGSNNIQEFLMLQEQPATNKITDESQENTIELEFSEGVVCDNESASVVEKKNILKDLGLNSESSPENCNIPDSKNKKNIDNEKQLVLNTENKQYASTDFTNDSINSQDVECPLKYENTDPVTSNDSKNACADAEKEFPLKAIQIDQHPSIDVGIDDDENSQNDKDTVNISENLQYATDIANETESIQIHDKKDFSVKKMERNQLPQTVTNDNDYSVESTVHKSLLEINSGKDNEESLLNDVCAVNKDPKKDDFNAESDREDNNKLHDSVGDKSMGILTQHGLKKPDVMLEIPTKELMNFMDDDEDDIGLLGNLAMSPDDAGIEICDQDDDIKERDITETLSESITFSDYDKDIETPTTIVKKVDDTDKPFGDIFKTKDISVKTVQDLNKEIQVDVTKGRQILSTVVDEPQPSTSKASMVTEMRRDSDEVGEVSDSLGLLAESTRVEYDEEQDDDDYRDDDEDFDQDEESSNQMAAEEYSEESNAVNFESDMPKTSQMESDNAQDGEEKDNQAFESKTETEVCNFKIADVVTESDIKGENRRNEETDHLEAMTSEEKLSVLGNENIDNTMVPTNDTEEQTNDAVLESHSEKLIDSTENEEDQNKALQLSTEKEDDYETKRTSGQTDEQPEEKEMDKEEVVCLESSDEESSQPGAKTSFPQGTEVPMVSEDVSRSSTLTETTEKSSSDSNLDNKGDEMNTAPPESETRKALKGLEVFSVDSDEEEQTKISIRPVNQEEVLEDVEKPPEPSKCINTDCRSASCVQYYLADLSVCKFYETEYKKEAVVCEPCVEAVTLRNQELIEGIKTFVPLLDLHSGKFKEELVEISDSESEEEDEKEAGDSEKIGDIGAKIVEEELTNLINETWVKYKMDSRLDDALGALKEDLGNVNAETEELDVMMNDCQKMIDNIRNELYESFPQERKEMPAIIIYDTPTNMYASFEEQVKSLVEPPQTRLKRRMSTVTDTPAKRLAVLPAQTSENAEQDTNVPGSAGQEKVDDDNVDVSVVRLCLESAPADLPPAGEALRPPPRVGMQVYAMRNAFGLWLKARIVEVQPKGMYNSAFTMCRVRFDHKVNKNPFKLLPARCLAYSEPAEVRLTIGTRVIASAETHQSFYSGVVAEVPNPVNNYRYLIFFDDGHAKYARHANTRLVCEHSPSVWEEVHPNSRDFVRQYLLSYPERPMVRLHPGQTLKTEWNNKWHKSRVVQVDASLALIRLAGERLEWVYRGSTRLSPLYLEMQAPERRNRPVPRSAHQFRNNVPYVEYTRYEEQQQSFKGPTAQTPQPQNEDQKRGQRAVAKKSLASAQPAPPPANAQANLDNVTSRVVYYTPKNAVRPYKLVPHQCSPKCKRTDVLALKDLRTYNPLAKPLLSGWERQIVRFKGHKEVIYRAPCGRRLRNMPELHRYLRLTKSDMSVDLFDYGPNTHCLAEFVLNKCLVGKKDLSHGKENVPVPCVNYYDETLPEFCSYNTERTPTAGVPLNLDPEFLCGCDCEDDCEDKSKCACWKMTIEGAKTIGLNEDVGYVYRRLPEQLPSGIYECNSRCKCKNTCLNRVAQHPLQLKLQVFKTCNRGWGIRALNDVPKGAFLCVYAGNLLTDATANLDGLNEGDEYLAELDYIEVVEQMKEGYEEDIPEADKKEDYSSEEEEEVKISKDEIDDDFQPGHIDVRPADFKKRLRTRERRKKDQNNSDEEKDKDTDCNKDKNKVKEVDKDNGDEDCITISDDEEVAREPSRFTAQAGMDANQLVSKYRSVRSYFGKDEACYIMDAKVQGNIGRYLNHSCCPNVFVQNVFVDTHDPRFPWVAFFALSHIRAGTELTWNYNYDVGSVPGKVLYCFCGAANCKGRLL